MNRHKGGYWYAHAIWESDLPPPARLIALVINGMADNETGQLTVSLSTLARSTGLGRSTVARMLTLLEKHRWVKRARPDPDKAIKQHHATRYTTVIPAGFPTKGSPSYGPASPAAGLGAGPRAGLGLVPETSKASPRAGPRSIDLERGEGSASPPPSARTSTPHQFAPDDDNELYCRCGRPPTHPVHEEAS